MKVVVYNREEMERAALEAFHIRIVIHDLFLPRPQLRNTVNCREVLYLSFDDISYESEVDQPFSIADSVRVAELLKRNCSEIDVVLVSCEAGLSRSPGMAAAIEEYYTGDESMYFWDSSKEPNRLVYEKMKVALGGR